MKKKTLAILLASAVAAVGLIGLTACSDKSGDGLQKGEKVTEEQWKAAIEATISEDNYTYTHTFVRKVTGSGTTRDGKKVNFKGEDSDTKKIYCDIANKMFYEEITRTTKSSGTNVFGNVDGYTIYSSLFYTVQEDDGVVWNASYYNDGEAVLNGDEEWLVDYSFLSESIADIYDFKLNLNRALEDIYELYSSFTYSDGIYTTTNYYYDQEYKIRISFKDGYVIGYALEYNEEYEDEEGIAYNSETVDMYNFSNFGTTTVNAPAGALEAIAAEKASNN